VRSKKAIGRSIDHPHIHTIHTLPHSPYVYIHSPLPPPPPKSTTHHPHIYTPPSITPTPAPQHTPHTHYTHTNTGTTEAAPLRHARKQRGGLASQRLHAPHPPGKPGGCVLCVWSYVIVCRCRCVCLLVCVFVFHMASCVFAIRRTADGCVDPMDGWMDRSITPVHPHTQQSHRQPTPTSRTCAGGFYNISIQHTPLSPSPPPHPTHTPAPPFHTPRGNRRRRLLYHGAEPHALRAALPPHLHPGPLHGVFLLACVCVCVCVCVSVILCAYVSVDFWCMCIYTVCWCVMYVGTRLCFSDPPTLTTAPGPPSNHDIPTPHSNTHGPPAP
jgi:hypothetical protein